MWGILRHSYLLLCLLYLVAQWCNSDLAGGGGGGGGDAGSSVQFPFSVP